MRMLATCALAGALALGGCGDSTPADYEAEPDPVTMPTPTDTPASSPSPPADAELGSDAVMQGEWLSKQMAGSPAALFGPPDTEAQFSVRCEGGDLVFVRSVSRAAGATRMSIMAGGETTRVDATAQSDPLPQVTGRLGAKHPFADVLAATPAPIAVSVADGPSYRMPSSDVFRKVVSDCAA